MTSERDDVLRASYRTTTGGRAGVGGSMTPLAARSGSRPASRASSPMLVTGLIGNKSASDSLSGGLPGKGITDDLLKL